MARLQGLLTSSSTPHPPWQSCIRPQSWSLLAAIWPTKLWKYRVGTEPPTNKPTGYTALFFSMNDDRFPLSSDPRPRDLRERFVYYSLLHYRKFFLIFFCFHYCCFFDFFLFIFLRCSLNLPRNLDLDFETFE